MSKFKFSYFQLTFGEEETYFKPEKSYERLKKYGYDAIELTPPKGRYGKGVSMEKYLELNKRLKEDFQLDVSCVNECWGAEWDPYSPVFKTLTEQKTADLAYRETMSTIDFASELGAPFVTVAVAVHDQINESNLADCIEVTVDTLSKMCDYAAKKGVKLVFEATNHLEMGKFVNTVMNHHAIIDLVQKDNIGIQIDCFHANFEELNPYEMIMDAGDRLWHMHFRDSNSLTPGYGTIDFKAVFRAMKKINYQGYCTIESSPLYPNAEAACKDGIDYLKMMEHVVEMQRLPIYPNGYAIKR